MSLVASMMTKDKESLKGMMSDEHKTSNGLSIFHGLSLVFRGLPYMMSALREGGAYLQKQT